MNRTIHISKKQLFLHTAAPLLFILLALWVIVTVAGLLILLPRAVPLLFLWLFPPLLLLLFVWFFQIGTRALHSDLLRIEQQEQWFGVRFDEELRGCTMRRNLYLDHAWYIAIDGMRLYAFRQGYLAGIVSSDGTHLTVQAIDGSTAELVFSDGGREPIDALNKFARGN